MLYATAAEEKTALRASVRARMKALSPLEREESDAALAARLLAAPEVAAASVLLLYCGMGAEIGTYRLIAPLTQAGKTVALPRCMPERGMEARAVTPKSALIRHKYGMLEPGEDCPLLSREEIDFILVPGLAFDQKGYRLGQGGGYYDRYLEHYRGVTLALCRDVFLLPSVPTEEHDRPVELVLTETARITPCCPTEG